MPAALLQLLLPLLGFFGGDALTKFGLSKAPKLAGKFGGLGSLLSGAAALPGVGSILPIAGGFAGDFLIRSLLGGEEPVTAESPIASGDNSDNFAAFQLLEEQQDPNVNDTTLKNLLKAQNLEPNAGGII